MLRFKTISYNYNAIGFVLLLFISSLSSAQSAITASNNSFEIFPFQHEIVSSSIVSNYKFINPFVFESINSNQDIFAYNSKLKSIHFSISSFPAIESDSQEVINVVLGQELIEVILRNEFGLTKSLSKSFSFTLPSNSLYDSFTGLSGQINSNHDVLTKAYNLGQLSDIKGPISFELRLKDKIKSDILFSIIVQSSDKMNSLRADVINYIYSPVTQLIRILGESGNIYTSFVNYKILNPELKIKQSLNRLPPFQDIVLCFENCDINSFDFYFSKIKNDPILSKFSLLILFEAVFIMECKSKGVSNSMKAEMNNVMKLINLARDNLYTYENIILSKEIKQFNSNWNNKQELFIKGFIHELDWNASIREPRDNVSNDSGIMDYEMSLFFINLAIDFQEFYCKNNDCHEDKYFEIKKFREKFRDNLIKGIRSY